MTPQTLAAALTDSPPLPETDAMKDLNYNLKQLAHRNHDGSYATQADRERMLSLFATQLHEVGYRQMAATSLLGEVLAAAQSPSAPRSRLGPSPAQLALTIELDPVVQRLFRDAQDLATAAMLCRGRYTRAADESRLLIRLPQALITLLRRLRSGRRGAHDQRKLHPLLDSASRVRLA